MMGFDFRRLLSPKVMLGALGLAVFLLLITFIWILLNAPERPQPGSFVATLTIIPAPTGTATPIATPSPDPNLTPTPIPGQVMIGSYVQVAQTGGQGLRIRANPGLKGEFLFLGLDSEMFIIRDGPVELDGYTWWLMTAPYDEQRSGWAASSFLEYIPPPEE
ncbi:MAG: hypothetical protein RBS68_01520 [Anaerolineales bacterium]|jgi:hypothetical protein|nr:hypothetical protein [Anaerolineales bacterium]